MHVKSAAQSRGLRVKAEIVEEYDSVGHGDNGTSMITQPAIKPAPVVPNEKLASSSKSNGPQVSVKIEENDESRMRWLALVPWLFDLWNDLPAVPSTESRRAWALARGVVPNSVHKWFGNRKDKRKKNGVLSHPQDGYELDIHDPPDSLIAPPPTTTATEPVVQTPQSILSTSSLSPPPQTPRDVDFTSDVEIELAPLFDNLSPEPQFQEASNSVLTPSSRVASRKASSRIRLIAKEETADSGLLPAPTLKPTRPPKRKAAEDIETDHQTGPSTAPGNGRTISQPVAKKAQPPKKKLTTKPQKGKEASARKAPTRTTNKKRARSPKPRKVKKEEVEREIICISPSPEPPAITVLSPTPVRNCVPPQLPTQQNTPTVDIINPTNLNIPPHSFASSTYTSLLVAPFAMDATAMHQYSLVDGCVLCQGQLAGHNEFMDFDFIEPFDASYFVPPQPPAVPQFDFSGYKLVDPNKFAADFAPTLQASFDVNTSLGLWDPRVENMPMEYLTGPTLNSNVGWP